MVSMQLLVVVFQGSYVTFRDLRVQRVINSWEFFRETMLKSIQFHHKNNFIGQRRNSILNGFILPFLRKKNWILNEK